MLRRLLACLALLTGLAAAGAPAQAEALALASRLEARAADATPTQSQAKSAVLQPSLHRDFTRVERGLPNGETPCAPLAAWQRSDRARE